LKPTALAISRHSTASLTRIVASQLWAELQLIHWIAIFVSFNHNLLSLLVCARVLPLANGHGHCRCGVIEHTGYCKEFCLKVELTDILYEKLGRGDLAGGFWEDFDEI